LFGSQHKNDRQWMKFIRLLLVRIRSGFSHSSLPARAFARHSSQERQGRATTIGASQAIVAIAGTFMILLDVFQSQFTNLTHAAFSIINSPQRVKELSEFLQSDNKIPGAIRSSSRGYSGKPVLAVVPAVGGIDVAVEWSVNKISCYHVQLPGQGQGSVPKLADGHWLVSFDCRNNRNEKDSSDFSRLILTLKLERQKLEKGSSTVNDTLYVPVERIAITILNGQGKTKSQVLIPVRLGHEEEGGEIDLREVFKDSKD